MAYEDNVRTAAEARGMRYPVRDADVSIGYLRFWGNDGPITIGVTVNNQCARFFFQIFAEELPRITDSLPGSLDCDAYMLKRAEEFFAEWWNFEPGQGTLPIIDALRTSRKVDLGWR